MVPFEKSLKMQRSFVFYKSLFVVAKGSLDYEEAPNEWNQMSSSIPSMYTFKKERCYSISGILSIAF